MSDHSLDELLGAFRTWIRGCDDHNVLQQAQEGLGGLLEDAQTRLRIRPRGLAAFEELVKACEEWIESQEDPGARKAAARLAEARFHAPVVDNSTFRARLEECGNWIEGLEIEAAEAEIETISYWFNETIEKVQNRRREFDQSLEEPEEGTYPERPISYDPSWGPSSPNRARVRREP